MRQVTRRKLYGRGAACGALHTAINSLQTAIEEAGKPQETPLHKALLDTTSALKRAADSFDTYNLKRKRLQKELKKEMVRIEDLLQKLQDEPITKEEKLATKRGKKEVKHGY